MRTAIFNKMSATATEIFRNFSQQTNLRTFCLYVVDIPFYVSKEFLVNSCGCIKVASLPLNSDCFIVDWNQQSGIQASEVQLFLEIIHCQTNINAMDNRMINILIVADLLGAQGFIKAVCIAVVHEVVVSQTGNDSGSSLTVSKFQHILKCHRILIDPIVLSNLRQCIYTINTSYRKRLIQKVLADPETYQFLKGNSYVWEFLFAITNDMENLPCYYDMDIPARDEGVSAIIEMCEEWKKINLQDVVKFKRGGPLCSPGKENDDIKIKNINVDALALTSVSPVLHVIIQEDHCLVDNGSIPQFCDAVYPNAVGIFQRCISDPTLMVTTRQYPHSVANQVQRMLEMANYYDVSAISDLIIRCIILHLKHSEITPMETFYIGRSVDNTVLITESVKKMSKSEYKKLADNGSFDKLDNSLLITLISERCQVDQNE